MIASCANLSLCFATTDYDFYYYNFSTKQKDAGDASTGAYCQYRVPSTPKQEGGGKEKNCD